MLSYSLSLTSILAAIYYVLLLYKRCELRTKSPRKFLLVELLSSAGSFLVYISMCDVYFYCIRNRWEILFDLLENECKLSSL